MSLPGNGIFVVQGEMAMLVTAMRRSTRWGSHSFPNEEYDVLMRTFQDLKTILNQVDDLKLLDPATYLSPFLEVIRSKETTGPVTSLALSAIHKFLSYGLIDPTHPSVPATVEDIADAVTHARFVGTDHSSDGVVLMKILQVLRTLMLSPEGAMLTDESVCEIMLSCFRICFETRLTELLRRNAEQCLRDMTQLIFMRLPQFPAEDTAATFASQGLSLNKRDKTTKRLAAVHNTNSLERKISVTEPVVQTESETDSLINRHNQDKNLLNEAEITIEPVEKKHARHSSMDLASADAPITLLLEKCVADARQDPQRTETDTVAPESEAAETKAVLDPSCKTPPASPPPDPAPDQPEEGKQEKKTETEDKLEEFTPQEDATHLQPYGLVCVRELFRFLISLCNPLDAQNTSAMVHLGLSLVGTALEVGADHLAGYPSLLYLIKDPLCRNLLSLLSTERISIFALDLQVSFLLFEALRFHLKYQMEAFFKKIIEIISVDTTKAIYELKEIHNLALESLCQMFRIPGLCTELYLNYDCDIYCTNIFEELTKLLSRNVVSSTSYNVNSVSLEALMTVIEAIEIGTNQKAENKSETEIGSVEEVEIKYGRGGHVSLELGGMDDASVVSDHVTHDISQYFGGSRQGRHRPTTAELPTEAELDNIRNMKKWVTQGTELFNQKSERGIEFLQEHGVLATPLDPNEVAVFLRENPDLDKKMIGEYICKRSSRGEDDGPSVLSAFADSFDFKGLRIDQALRLYLETFRLPGEAPLIFLVMERFAERWHTTNGEPFANTDAAFRLAYAVIMLNMDQHNHNAKKLNVPMTVEDFVKNLRGCNGVGDFPQPMLEAIFHSIKNEEMVMPAERVGPVRDAYLWRVLQRRGGAAAARYRGAPPHHTHNARLFAAACPPTVAALSAAFERAPAPTAEEVASNNVRDSFALQALCGLERCAALVAKLPPDSLTLDSLLLTLCKFTGLLAQQNTNYIAIGVALGQSSKSQVALTRAFAVTARHADCARGAWRHLLEIVNILHAGRLLPKCMTEVEDYLSPTGTVSLIREAARGSDAGLLSSIYSYIALGESGVRAPTPHEKALIDVATECVAKCNLPGLLVTETKFLQQESLQELIRAMITVGTPPDAECLQMNPQLEDVPIFFLELLGQTLIQNRDRLLTVWEDAGPHIRLVVLWTAQRGGEALTRSLTCLLRTAAKLMRCDHCAATALHHLTLLFQLPYKLFYQQADVISCGLYELVKTSAQNVHTAADWDVVFALLLAAGAGVYPTATGQSTSSRSEGSEDESERRPTSVSSESELSHSPQTQGWIVVKRSEPGRARARAHALARSCETLSLVARDVAHVTPHNCALAVRAVTLLAGAALQPRTARDSRNQRPRSRLRQDDSSDEEVDTLDQYHMVSIQLLDLMHTLLSRIAQIFKWWRDEADQGAQGAEEYDLWEVAWMPLLQGIAQFCTDRRKQVANSAIAYLQRALLVPTLAHMGSDGWEACFQRVLFPLLRGLPRRADCTARAHTIVCKVFLQHLSALSRTPRFGALWLRLVALQRALLAAAAPNSAPADDALTEAALESLKNMILVMDSVKIFSNAEGYNDLWYMTWDKIGEFLPNLKEELFPHVKDEKPPLPPHLPAALPALVPAGPASNPSLLPITPPIIQHPQHQTSAQNNQPFSQHLTQRPSSILVQNLPQSPVSIAPNPPTLVIPTPISGTVPIRNQLYDQAGLASSVLLQPLNEMISTPIGISIQSQMPILYPQTTTELLQPQQAAEPVKIEPQTTQPTLEIPQTTPIEKEIEQSELYAEYLTNPYNEKEFPTKAATIYDPESLTPNDQNILNLEQKSFSANSTPMHKGNKAQFGSTDNVSSGMFNFSSYFGGVNERSSEVFDALMSTQEG
ncbi:Golgi-specific brefeldin A-resistance guanine nucleotide exchange factor 1 isoform X2 [Plodia interpunctella]|uniref:Golgi-specific brefeldin A-resistance guanine nucleotide exchange factor 1 isoform X2 n=1 Tax=Plodia interpunctella TaxID=58824 RepID=UPI002368E8AA|nr:Golgi-specific brefeldin A-resistance guanine nucleotide exchange factor 1 isoform X2 [Plodia interpunctella]